jgi:hypothetical protein
MHKPNDLEHNLRTLVEAKVLNLDVSLATIVNAGALAGLERGRSSAATAGSSAAAGPARCRSSIARRSARWCARS